MFATIRGWIEGHYDEGHSKENGAYRHLFLVSQLTLMNITSKHTWHHAPCTSCIYKMAAKKMVVSPERLHSTINMNLQWMKKFFMYGTRLSTKPKMHQAKYFCSKHLIMGHVLIRKVSVHVLGRSHLSGCCTCLNGNMKTSGSRPL